MYRAKFELYYNIKVPIQFWNFYFEFHVIFDIYFCFAYIGIGSVQLLLFFTSVAYVRIIFIVFKTENH